MDLFIIKNDVTSGRPVTGMDVIGNKASVLQCPIIPFFDVQKIALPF